MHYDIAIIGAGYVGLTAALALKNSGFKVLVIEKRKLEISKKENEPSRLLAIAYASCNILKSFGFSEDFSKLGQPINAIKVMDANSSDFLEFNPKDIDVANFGFMIEEHILHEALLQSSKDIEIIDQIDIKSINQDQYSSTLELANGTIIHSKMCLVADGKHSKVRDMLGIETRKHDYKQYAVVCDLAHEYDHCGVALERFLPTGPFGILPKKGGYVSSIVWSVENELMKSVKSLDKETMLSVISERFGDEYGELRLASDVRQFPLELVHAKQIYNGRFVLIGDSAHAIHPLAGQGLNLSIRDLDSLVSLIIKQKELGLDIGSSIMLEEYVKSRKFDNNLMIESTHGLNYLFSNSLLPVKFLRRKGLSIVNQIKPLKKWFMRYACGL